MRIGLLTLGLLAVVGLAKAEDGWIELFDGKSLAGWKAAEDPSSFSIENGMIKVAGKRAHLFYDGPVKDHQFKNFELKVELKTMPKANSGIYFHTEFQDTNWPAKGYEVQVNTTHGDVQKSGSLYGIVPVTETYVKDDEWFTETIKVVGKHVTVKVNDKQVVDYTEPANAADEPARKNSKGRLVTSGTFALQAHDPGSVVYYRKISVKPLP